MQLHCRQKLSKRMVYKLNNYNGEPVTGSWYDEELSHIYDNQYRIERVIRRRTAADGNKEVFVKWDGWQEKWMQMATKSTIWRCLHFLMKMKLIKNILQEMQKLEV